MCSALRRPILVTAAEFDNSDGLQHTLDFVAEHSIATPLLVIVLLACQAGAMVAAANFGTPIPVKARVVTASAHLRCCPNLPSQLYPTFFLNLSNCCKWRTRNGCKCQHVSMHAHLCRLLHCHSADKHFRSCC